MNEQEAQQAQTIAEIRDVRDNGQYAYHYYRAIIDKALAIVDSQAQKIAEQAMEIERLKDDLLQARRCAEGMADSHAILDGDESEIEYRLQMRRKRSPLPWETADSKEALK